MADLLTVQNAIALVTLTLLEIVLGIDNIVFITVLTSRLEQRRRAFARNLGLALAMLMRIGLLFSLSWVLSLKDDLFTVAGQALSWKDLILIGGGAFLIAKATHEIHANVEHRHAEARAPKAAGVGGVIAQIVLLDIVFSLDSVITAVGMAESIPVMVAAVVIAVAVMMLFAAPVGSFVERNPAMKILALSFLVLIGVALVADGFEAHLPRGYVYSAMGFSFLVELLQLRMGAKAARREDAPGLTPPAPTSEQGTD
jgi:predicted tellurium resistance membrane protein TerC